VLAFLPRATKRSSVKTPGGIERMFVTGVTPEYARYMNRPIQSGRGITEDDRKRRSTVAVVGATLGAKLFGGADPVGRDIVVEGVPYRIVGLQDRLQVFSEEIYYDANGIQIPLETYMDRMDPAHQLTSVAVKLARKSDLGEVSSVVIGRVKQAHHGIEDVEIKDLEAEAAKWYQQFLNEMRGWRIVLSSLAATVLLVGGVGVLSVMLISFSDRRYEIGLRKSLGASDSEILLQFLLEAAVLASLGAFVGTVAGAALCQALSPMFPWGLVVNPVGLLVAWCVALSLALVFGLYPAVRASRLTPMEAMR
jgi:putative ABC transport system permease protein